MNTCANCDVNLAGRASAVYDDYREQYFCTRSCYADWAADNAEYLAQWYAKLNVEVVAIE